MQWAVLILYAIKMTQRQKMVYVDAHCMHFSRSPVLCCLYLLHSSLYGEFDILIGKYTRRYTSLLNDSVL
jgi:hypothetical protein